MSREEFEKWAGENTEFDLSGHDCGVWVYDDIGTHSAWTAWQARQPEIDALRASVAELEGAVVPILSRDYSALHDLLLSGGEALGLVNYGPDDKTFRDPVSIRRYGECQILIGARGISYGDVYPFMLEDGMNEKSLFISICEMTNLEWVCVSPAPMVPEGWKLVPIEPDKKMEYDAAFNLCSEFGVEFTQANREFALRAYYWLVNFAAAPAPVQTECGNCFEGKSDLDHKCRKCDGTGIAAPVQEVKSCEWSNIEADGSSDTWQGDCGFMFTLINDGPVENEMKFCPCCGGKITVAAPEVKSC